MRATEQFWAGQFGDEYTQRNQPEVSTSQLFFENALRKAHTSKIDTIIELGANRGHNLVALKRMMSWAETCGVEVNQTAYAELTKAADEAYLTSFLDMPLSPWGATQWDLVVTKGVLIHIDPTDLERAYQVIRLISRRYILIAEYFSPEPVHVEYRGEKDRLWKRDFAGELLDSTPGLELVDYGFAYKRATEEDNLTWFLLEKKR